MTGRKGCHGKGDQQKVTGTRRQDKGDSGIGVMEKGTRTNCPGLTRMGRKWKGARGLLKSKDPEPTGTVGMGGVAVVAGGYKQQRG